MEIDHQSQPGLIASTLPDQNQLQPGLIPVTPSTEEPNYNDPPYKSRYQPIANECDASEASLRVTERRILGLRVVTFWLIVALAIAIVAAAVGGGVGSSLAVQKAKSDCDATRAAAAQSVSGVPASITTSPTGTATATPQWGPLQPTPTSGCPANNGSTYSALFNKDKYKIYCNLDIPNTATSDLMYLITPTFKLCMEACSSWNDNGKSLGGVQKTCMGVAFIPTHINGDAMHLPADCVLKSTPNATDVLQVNQNYEVVSGVHISA